MPFTQPVQPGRHEFSAASVSRFSSQRPVHAEIFISHWYGKRYGGRGINPRNQNRRQRPAPFVVFQLLQQCRRISVGREVHGGQKRAARSIRGGMRIAPDIVIASGYTTAVGELLQSVLIARRGVSHGQSSYCRCQIVDHAGSCPASRLLSSKLRVAKSRVPDAAGASIAVSPKLACSESRLPSPRRQ